jgi:hypothetical protein
METGEDPAADGAGEMCMMAAGPFGVHSDDTFAVGSLRRGDFINADVKVQSQRTALRALQIQRDMLRAIERKAQGAW